MNSALGFGQDAEFSFLARTIELEKITEGDTVSVDFEFTNSGSTPIQIESIESCHCTQTIFDKSPIAPGAKSTITAIFDSHDMVGKNEKVLAIWYNDNPLPYKVRFLVLVKRRKKRVN